MSTFEGLVGASDRQILVIIMTRLNEIEGKIEDISDETIAEVRDEITKATDRIIGEVKNAKNER